MGVALNDLRGKVKRPVRSVRICLDGDLWSRHDELSAKLEQLRLGGTANKMAESPEVRQVAAELRDVEADMRDSEVIVEMRGVSIYQLKAIQKRFPSSDPREEWDVNEGAAALIAACAVEPTTEDDAKALLDEVHQGVARKLFGAAWEATTASDDVPFSVRASALTGVTASK